MNMEDFPFFFFLLFSSISVMFCYFHLRDSYILIKFISRYFIFFSYCEWNGSYKFFLSYRIDCLHKGYWVLFVGFISNNLTKLFHRFQLCLRRARWLPCIDRQSCHLQTWVVWPPPFSPLPPLPNVFGQTFQNYIK